MFPKKSPPPVSAGTYIIPMSERRIVKANPHAIPLMLDIVESTAFLPGGDRLRAEFVEMLSSEAATQSSFGSCEYYIAFEDHFPFGFVGLAPLDDCGEVRGPFLYRDYLGQGYGEYLLSQIHDMARSRELRLLYALIPADAQKAQSFLVRNGFELISTDSQFIRRWRDGLLADACLETGTALLAQLVEHET
jgi:N-acetylglutamate synthase-like GNAT family acetyltransferase